MNRNIINCLRRSLATVAIILGMSCMAKNAYAQSTQMPTDISYYTDEGIIKASTDDYNIDIEVKYLAYEVGTCNTSQYCVAFLESPSSVKYNITGNIGNSGFQDYTKYEYVELDKFTFIDLQSIEVGDWHLRLVQSYAGRWYYTTEVLGENNPNIIAEIEGLKFILNTETLEAKLSANNYSDTEFTVPSTVDHEGKTYTVTTLNGNCFYNCTNINKITLPKTITTIGINCFLNCSNLKSLIITSTTPPTCKGDIGINSNVNIGVPTELISTYESDDYWKRYYIRDMSDLPGDIITTDDNLKLQLYPQSQTATLLPNNYDRSGTFMVPETVTYEGVTYTITSLGDNCFYNCSNITNISLPSTLKTIGNNCFFYCSALESMIIPEGVTSLGEQCFKNCYELQFIEIPESVKSIGSSCFDHCTTLQKIGIVIKSTTPPSLLGDISMNIIYVPEEAVETYKANEFWKYKTIYQMDDFHFADIVVNGFKYDIYYYKGEAKLLKNGYSSENIEIPESVNYQGKTYPVTELASHCFSYSENLKSIVLPNSIKIIGDNCFYGCNALNRMLILSTVPPTISGFYIKNIYVPEEAIEIYKNDDKWGKYNIYSIKKYAGDVITIGELKLQLYPYDRNNVGLLPNNYNGNEPFVVPETVTDDDGTTYTIISLENECFYNCKNIPSVSLPITILSLGDKCFYGCSAMTTINIPNSATEFGTECFYDCSSLTSINIPEGVCCLKVNSFYNCSKLETITIPESVTRLDKYCFAGTGISEIDIPESVTELPEGCFYGCTSLKSINLPDGLTSIGADCFRNCSGLSISLPDGLTSIEGGCFMYCNFESITIPESVNYIGSSCFYGCRSLKSIIIPEGLRELSDNCFSDCTGLNSISLPESLESIGSNCFTRCGLAELIIPKNVTSIGTDCFLECNSLIENGIIINAIDPSLLVYDLCVSKVYVPDEAVNTYQSYWENIEVYSHSEYKYPQIAINDINYDLYPLIGEASVAHGNYQSEGLFVVPETVQYNNKTYTVTMLNDWCFYHEDLYAIELPKTITSIGDRSFRGNNVILWAPIPPSLGLDNSCNVYVPDELFDTYINEKTSSYGNWEGINILSIRKFPCGVFEVDGLKYQLYPYDSPNVGLLPNNYNNEGEFTVPATVTANDNTYNVSVIENNCFKGCSSITSFNFEGEIKAIGKYAFSECSSLENFVVPEGVTSLEPSTFYNCSKLTNITLPESLEFIGDMCFHWCRSLKSIVIPKNVTYMGKECLNYTSISDVLMYPTTPPEANTGLPTKAIIYVDDEARNAYQNDAYWNQYNIKSKGEFPGVEIVAGNFRYQLHIFNDDATLISATPDKMGIVNVPTAVTYNDKTYTVTVIGDNSLRNSNIKHVVLPEGIKKLGQSCFNYELKVVNIPSTVDEIYQNCFSGCSSQLKVQVDAQIPTTYGDISLPSGATLYMSDDLKASYSGDEYWNQFSIMPSEELYIDNVNIDGCVYDVYLNKHEVTLKTSDYNGESNYTVKETAAYNGEEYLTTAISDRCFIDKSVLETVSLPSAIISLGSYCFGNCTSLTEITLSESLTTLGEYCFSGCSFSTITLPQNVTSVGTNCFYNCSKMTALLVDAVEPPVCPNGIGLSTDNVTIFVPSESIAKYREDAIWGQFTIKPKEEYSFKEEVVGDLKYKLFNYNNVATVIANGYDKPSAYTIPSSITASDGNSYTVTSIDNGAFKDCGSITGITLPNSIVRLGDQCFAGCGSITTITIPNGITTWGEYCFSGCSSLKEINFEDGLTSLGDRAFYGCSSLKSVTIPDCITTIGEECFANCDNLKSMLLTSATPPTCNNSLGLAGDATIYVESSLVDIYNTADVWQNYTIAAREGYPAGEYTTSDGYKYTYYPYALKGTLIANNYNSNATFTVPKSFEKDGETYTVNAIGENCFTGCDFINEIAIPSCINTVAANCFDGCNALKSVMMEGATPPSSTSVIYLPNSAVIYVDDANLQTYKASDTWKQNTIKSKMEYAGQEVEVGGFKYLLYPYAGEACLLPNNYDKPESITIPSTFTSGGKTYTVTAIGNDCFKDCSRITGITIPESVIGLGDQCFAGCSGITAITIPNSITSWGEYCFLGCGGLKDITLSEGLSSIGKYAFYNCGALKAITIPESITSIGEGVFADCYEMKKILMTSTTPPTCSGGLGLRDEAKVYVPEDVVDIYQGTDYWNSCNIVSRAEYPMGDYVIGGLKYTLYPYSQKATLVANNYSDTKIDIPGSVTYDGVSYTVEKIADNCFYGCENLTEVILPETIVSIGDNCFGECNALTTVLSLASTPPVCTGNLALGSNAKVYVANEDIETYQNDSNWGQSKVESYDKFAVETIADRGEFKYRLYPFTLKATLLGNSYSNSTTIEVPETTVYDGKTYQVTGIGKYCFYTCSSVTEIVLPNTITTIEDWAFAECSSLVKLTLPENVSNIGQNVFKKTSKLENIKCLATTPPSCTGDLLFKDGATIYVPSESVDTYKRTMYWEMYEIKSVDEFVDGIDAPIMDADDDVKVYDLNGLRLEAKGKGLRILRSKGKTKKVVVK